MWTTRRRFIITIVSVTGAQYPLPDLLKIGFTNFSDIRNYPPQCAPLTASTSVTLRGDFGPSTITVVSVVAKDPTDASSLYTNGSNLVLFDFLSRPRQPFSCFIVCLTLNLLIVSDALLHCS